jgi:hypothetical protein
MFIIDLRSFNETGDVCKPTEFQLLRIFITTVQIRIKNVFLDSHIGGRVPSGACGLVRIALCQGETNVGQGRSNGRHNVKGSNQKRRRIDLLCADQVCRLNECDSQRGSKDLLGTDDRSGLYDVGLQGRKEGLLGTYNGELKSRCDDRRGEQL